MTNGPKVQFTVLFTYFLFFLFLLHLSFISVVDNIIYVIFLWWEGVLPNHKKKEMR